MKNTMKPVKCNTCGKHDGGFYDPSKLKLADFTYTCPKCNNAHESKS